VVDTEHKVEQQHLDLLYGRLDELRARSERALDQVRRAPTAGTPAARGERDAFVALHAARLAQLRSVEERLCFGRLDLTDGERRYVGRVGLADEEHRQLLLDWRAPAAEPFYRATGVAPSGVVRRRSIATKDRQVTGLEDEVLDLDAFDPERDGPAVAGEGALMVALGAARTGKMRDIVGTIQAEQDRVIRAPLSGVLVVQGGPGTGKTAVALHRTAYLLYTHRDRIASSGVLLVGPNTRFLRYIDAVLPALGEAEATVLATPATLYPGIVATGSEDLAVAAVKGDPRMERVLARAVRDRQRPLPATVRLAVDGRTVDLRPADVRAAHDKARRSGKPHNAARVVFVKHLLGVLATRLGGGDLDAEERAARIADLRDSKDVRRELNGCWPPLSPERLLRDLYAQPERLDSAGSVLSRSERALLARDRRAAWTPADVPLLDEAAELLGTDAPAEAPGGPSAEELAHAREVLRDSPAAGMVSAEQLAARWGSDPVRRSVAEHAAGDREWTFGHVVVDEAQELSPMAWRLLMRRCPTRSMTVVGDLAQTGALGGVRSWARTLRPYVGDRATIETLTVNYRTPQQLMDLAAAVLRAQGVPVTPPVSARSTPWAPVLSAGDPVAAAPAAVADELDQVGSGTVGVLCPPALLAGVRALVPDTDRVSVLTVLEAKGLEFDAVVLVEPAGIVAASPRGAQDLYVAITRATQRLHVLHARPLPPGFEEVAQDR
jgi:DNA helicase IV